MQTLSQYLGLRDPERNGLEPSPSSDHGLYVDLDEHLRKVTEELAKRQPRMAVTGEYGTGKSHLLLRALNDADALDRFTTVYAELQAHPRPSSATVHGDVFRAMERRGVIKVLTDSTDIESAPEFKEVIPGVGRAFSILGENDVVRRAQAQSWLWGAGITAAGAMKLGLPGRLTDAARGVEIVKIWAAIAAIYERLAKRKVLLGLDEAEAFQKTLRPDGAVDIGTALRTLMDTTQSHIGYFIGLTLPETRSDHPLLRTDVAGRIQGQRLELSRLGPGRTKKFVRELLELLAKNRTRIATDDFIEAFEELDSELVNRLGSGPKSATGLTQRQAVKVLNAVYGDAFHLEAELPLSGEALRRWRK